MDWIQFPFEVDAHLHDGPGAPVVRLRWMFTDLPFFPVGSHHIVNNRIWNEDHDTDLNVGQLPIIESNFDQDARWLLPALAFDNHLCHPEWFSTGEPWPAAISLPPTAYLAGWIPECCATMCEFDDCISTEINGEPASYGIQYATKAKDATGSTPAKREVVAVAYDTAGGFWPGASWEYAPAGRLSAPVYYNRVVCAPSLVPSYREDHFEIDGDNQFTRTQDATGETWTVTHQGTVGTFTLRNNAGVIELCGANAVICEDLLPDCIVCRLTGTVNGVGMTQAGAAPLTNGSWQTNSTPGNKAFVLPADGAAVVDVFPDLQVGGGPQLIYPPPGEAIIGTSINAAHEITQTGPPWLAWRFTRVVFDVLGDRRWLVQQYKAGGALAGTVSSVGVTAPAAGITTAGGPITTAGSIALALADDLAALESLAGTNTIYYRSGVSAWSAVTIGANLTFAGGTLSAAAPGTGTVTSVGVTAPAAGITSAGGPIITAGSITLALADDLAALEALSGTNTIYYRSGASAWSAVTIGDGLAFATGTLQTGVATVAKGGTGVATLTANALVVAHGTGAFTATAAGANNALLNGVSGGTPIWKHLIPDNLNTTGWGDVEVYLSANQSLTGSAWNTINLNTETTDADGLFNTTTHAYTPAVTGLYDISFFASIGGATGRVIAAVRSGGADVAVLSDGSLILSGGTRPVNLTAGTAYVFCVFPTNTPTDALGGAANTSLVIRRVR